MSERDIEQVEVVSTSVGDTLHTHTASPAHQVMGLAHAIARLVREHGLPEGFAISAVGAGLVATRPELSTLH